LHIIYPVKGVDAEQAHLM